MESTTSAASSSENIDLNIKEDHKGPGSVAIDGFRWTRKNVCKKSVSYNCSRRCKAKCRATLNIFREYPHGPVTHEYRVKGEHTHACAILNKVESEEYFKRPENNIIPRKREFSSFDFGNPSAHAPAPTVPKVPDFTPRTSLENAATKNEGENSSSDRQPKRAAGVTKRYEKHTEVINDVKDELLFIKARLDSALTRMDQLEKSINKEDNDCQLRLENQRLRDENSKLQSKLSAILVVSNDRVPDSPPRSSDIN
mmetsp:Transcript_7688/g.16453  ORF Transcript_7688/g.16453 Transcript_7688/m.16453 type:complete len:254 (-) Transcript_7688:45-806(-)